MGECSLYPALQRLLLNDWVKATWGVSQNNRRARYYTLTAAGRKRLAAERHEHGVTSYAVTRRQAEISIRIALGAEPAGVLRLVLVRVFMLVALGVIIGSAVSAWLSQFIASLLYDLQPRDAVTLVSAVLALTAVALIAGWLPARRASRIDPAQVLRES